jgi:hypothetical protein
MWIAIIPFCAGSGDRCFSPALTAGLGVSFRRFGANGGGSVMNRFESPSLRKQAIH